ncbi:MAG: antitoxin, RHH family protein [Candidatus Omnitrophica bacterium]|nr:antitoxin, RHH family protein [Candidatus Omnitrophota bacterium]
MKKMPTKNPRLNVVLEPSVYQAIKRLADKDGVSLSLKARDLIHLALQYYEDLYWTKIANAREKTLAKKKPLAHKEVWS